MMEAYLLHSCKCMCVVQEPIKHHVTVYSTPVDVFVCSSGTCRVPSNRAGHDLNKAARDLRHASSCVCVCVCVVQEPFECHVIEQGMFVKHSRVEVCSTPVDMSVFELCRSPSSAM